MVEEYPQISGGLHMNAQPRLTRLMATLILPAHCFGSVDFPYSMRYWTETEFVHKKLEHKSDIRVIALSY